MRRSKFIVRLFLLLTLLQIFIFIFRHHFQYQPYSTPSKLYTPCDSDCINTWGQFAHDYPASELARTAAIADSVIAIPRPTASQILMLGKFLYARFYRQLGRPDDSLLTLSPLQQYERLSSDTTRQLWCGNFAQIFAFFCWSKGIACRMIEIMKEGDHHVLNECYLPELKQWVMVDLTHNLLMTTDSTENPMTTTEFIKALRPGGITRACRTHDTDGVFDPLTADRAALSHYYNSSYPLYYYHRTDNTKAYSPGNKLKQYFLPVSWYDILTPEKRTNALFYLKEALVLLWLLALLALLTGRPKFGL